MGRPFGKRKGQSRPIPTSEDVKKAVEMFLKGGGSINRIEADEKSYNAFMNNKKAKSEVDQFLMG